MLLSKIGILLLLKNFLKNTTFINPRIFFASWGLNLSSIYPLRKQFLQTKIRNNLKKRMVQLFIIGPLSRPQSFADAREKKTSCRTVIIWTEKKKNAWLTLTIDLYFQVMFLTTFLTTYIKRKTILWYCEYYINIDYTILQRYWSENLWKWRKLSITEDHVYVKILMFHKLFNIYYKTIHL